MPATASNTVRNRPSSSADRRTGGAAVSSPITSANYRGPSGALRHLPINGEEVASPAPSAPPPHQWGRRPRPLRRLRRHLPMNGDGAAPLAPSAPPPHEWDGAAPPAPSAPPPHEWGGVDKNEAAPAADTASTGRPPGDTRLVSAPLYGRCLLLEANLCVNCRRTRTENELTPQCDDPRTMSRGLSICRLLHLR